MRTFEEYLNERDSKLDEESGRWMQDAKADIEKRGTEGVCTGKRLGSASCPAGSKRFTLAKTFKKEAKDRKKED